MKITSDFFLVNSVSEPSFYITLQLQVERAKYFVQEQLKTTYWERITAQNQLQGRLRELRPCAESACFRLSPFITASLDARFLGSFRLWTSLWSSDECKIAQEASIAMAYGCETITSTLRSLLKKTLHLNLYFTNAELNCNFSPEIKFYFSGKSSECDIELWEDLT